MLQKREKTTKKLSLGRPPGRVPRPHIPIDGDTLVPKAEAARDLGISTRTLSRMRPASTLIGGISYVSMAKLRQQIAAGLSSPKKRGRR